MSMNVRPALETLDRLDGGKLLDRLALAINEATSATTALGKKSRVIISIDIALLTQQHVAEPAISVTGAVSSKLPKSTPESAIFFVDADGNPTNTSTPRQRDLEIRVATDQGEVVNG